MFSIDRSKKLTSPWRKIIYDSHLRKIIYEIIFSRSPTPRINNCERVPYSDYLLE